ncbi:hypothetical protein [Paenibacillus chibensis]|uniref:hypothetical protein n=1 Tax=Paenibacillus chibensis TaxID=59846 RepID=UPI000FD81A6F|nr:hypothetical protein [Paenibacillus chibensis]MEC0371344.1 hypothetical protein [Paenibacillus chibensis]
MKPTKMPLAWGVLLISVFILVYSLAAPAQPMPSHSEENGAVKILDEVSSVQTAEASTLRTDLGSITYGLDDHVVNLILDLNLGRHEKVGIQFLGAEQAGALLGRGNVSIKVGSLGDDTTFIAENHRLAFWSQQPIRFLGDGNDATVIVTDQDSGQELLKQKLIFRSMR